MEFPNAWGGKISMPPVVGVRIFSGTTHSTEQNVEWGRGEGLFVSFIQSILHCNEKLHAGSKYMCTLEYQVAQYCGLS